MRGLSWEIKSTPVIAGDVVFINGYGSPEGDPGRKISLPSADEVWQTADADKNGTLSKAEFPKGPPNGWFAVADLDTDGAITKSEWEYIRAALESENGMLAIRLGGSGDMTAKSVIWKYHRSVPQLPSPLLYNNVLYMVNDGGIVTSFNPATGEVIKQGRLTGALGNYFASPVAADGHVFFASQPGVIAVLNARRRPDAAGRESAERRHLRDAGRRRRTHLRQDDAGALGVWESRSGRQDRPRRRTAGLAPRACCG